MESRLFGSSRRPPRSLAARVLGAQSSSCLSLEGASRRAGALLCGQGPRPRESVQGGRAQPLAQDPVSYKAPGIGVGRTLAQRLLLVLSLQCWMARL